MYKNVNIAGPSSIVSFSHIIYNPVRNLAVDRKRCFSNNMHKNINIAVPSSIVSQGLTLSFNESSVAIGIVAK